MLGLDALELDGDLLTRDDVGSEVDVSERSATNLAADTVLVADAEILHTRVSTLRSFKIRPDSARGDAGGDPAVEAGTKLLSSSSKKLRAHYACTLILPSVST